MNLDFQLFNSNKIPWRESKFAEGIKVKDLGQSGRAMQLVEFSAGAKFPVHVHKGPEFIFVLEGEVIQEGRRLSAGSSSVAGEGTKETEFYSETGALFLLVYSE